VDTFPSHPSAGHYLHTYTEATPTVLKSPPDLVTTPVLKLARIACWNLKGNNTVAPTLEFRCTVLNLPPVRRHRVVRQIGLEGELGRGAQIVAHLTQDAIRPVIHIRRIFEHLLRPCRRGSSGDEG